LAPSPTLARWSQEAAATPLDYPDGHTGLIVTRHALARDLLADPRFAVGSPHMPGVLPPSEPDELDDEARAAMDAANLLALNGEQHRRIRTSVLSDFSARAVRVREQAVEGIVRSQLDNFLALPQPADIYAHYANPIAARIHCLVLGIPDAMAPEFVERFVAAAGSTQQRFDFIRAVMDARANTPGEDVVSHLLASQLTRTEVQGVLAVLMRSGRDSVAYMITTALTGLLTHPEQLSLLRGEPDRILSAVEEFMRAGAMFVTLFPRTAVADAELDGIPIPAGTTVAVSPVAANHDERQYERPAEFDITRDSAGHLGFGHGPHACLGQQLARLEICEAITQLLAKAPRLRLVNAEQLEPLPFANPVATYEAGALMVTWG